MRVRPAQLTAALLCAALGAPVAAGASSAPRHATSQAFDAAFPGGQQRGFIINGVNQEPAAVVEDLERMRQDGANTISVYIALHTTDKTSSDVTTGLDTPSDQQLQVVVALAHAVGLQVVFLPFLEDAAGEWHGYFNPTDIEAFFQNWTTMVVRYADLAQSLGVSMFYVGAEQNAVAGRAGQWREVVANVRRHYDGVLTYLSTAAQIAQVSWWDALDVISVSPYFSLSWKPVPTYAEVVRGWEGEPVRYLRSMYQRFHMPIVFGEIGYRSQPGALDRPAEQPPSSTASMATQANGYAGLLDVTAKSLPFVKGIDWFYWASPARTPVDPGWSPENKWAECVTARRWGASAGWIATLDCPPPAVASGAAALRQHG